MRADDQRRVPVPLHRRLAGGLARLDVDRLAALLVVAHQAAVLPHGVDDVRVARLGQGLVAVAADGHVPVLVGDAGARGGARRTALRVVVLGAAVDVVEGLGVVDRHAVVLPQRHVGLELPGRAGVPGLVDAAVAADQQVVGVGRVDPQRVVVDVAVLALHPAPALAAVAGDLQEGVEHVDLVDVDRVADQLVVVLRAGAHLRALLLPGLAAVGGAEDAALAHGRLDDGVDHVRVDRGQVEADAALVDLRQPLLGLAPGLAAVLGLPDGRARAAVDQGPDVPPPLVGAGVHQVRVAGVHVDLVDAGVLVDVQHPPPGRAAVGGLVQPAIPARAPQRPLRRHEHDIRVPRVDRDHADVLRLLEPELVPVLAAVAGAVHPVAEGHRTLRVVLTRPDPHDLRVARLHRQAADRIGPLPIEHRRPGRTRVPGHPDPARRRRRPEPLRMSRLDREVGDPPRREGRADRAELQPRQGPRVQPPLLLRGLLLRFLSHHRTRSRTSPQDQSQRHQCPHDHVSPPGPPPRNPDHRPSAPT